MLQKIKSQMSYKIFCLGVLIFEIVACGVLCFQYSKREHIELNFTQDDLIYDSGESGFYLDKGYEAKYILTPRFTLPAGLYTLYAQCEYAGDIKVSVQHTDTQFDANISGDIDALYSGDVSYDFKVKYGDRPIQIQSKPGNDMEENEYILVRNIRIVQASSAFRNYLFQIILFFILVDAIILLFFFREKLCHLGTGTNIKILMLLIVFSSIPLMTNYLFKEPDDLQFHLMRIEGIKDGLLNGSFPVRIQPAWLNGHGYAVSVFYGDFFLYIPAILRVFGISMMTSYKCYVLFINTITILIAYYCFSKMSNSGNGIVCAIVYSLNMFRMHNLYSMIAVGEYTAITFIPLVIYGLWKVYTLPEESKEHRRSWITIAGGCTGIFLSHIISTEMTAVFVVLLVIILWKKTLRRRTLFVLAKAAAATVSLSLWFLVPFLDYMLNGTYVINSTKAYKPFTLEGRGIFPAQFFMVDYNVMGGASRSWGEAAASTPLTVGCAEIAVLAAWLFLCLGKKERSKSERKEEYLTVAFILLTFWMTTYLFPYTWLAERFPILQVPENSIQYPWRFYVITGAILVYLLCQILKKSWIGDKKKKLLVGLLIGLSVCQSLFYMSSCLKESHSYRIYQGGMTSFCVIGGEYIPIDQEASIILNEYMGAYVDQLTYEADAIQVEEWCRDRGAIEVSLNNGTEDICQVEVPLLLYKGYYAITDSGEELEISPGESYRISVAIPAGFSGSFRVAFREPWYWRVCEIISLLMLIGMVFCMIYDKKQWKFLAHIVEK